MNDLTQTQPQDRRDELKTNLAAVHARIDRACAAAGRDPREISLIAVTKRFPGTDADTLVDLGIRDVGENLDQEASAKVAQLARRAQVRVHFIGQLQSNKARHVAGYADVIQSVDRPRLLSPIARGAGEAGRAVDVLIQVSLDGDPARGGTLPVDVPGLADEIVSRPGLRLRGVMAVAPLDRDPAGAFADLAIVSRSLRERHSQAEWISAGMSSDLEAAVAHGATHLRVGAAILGSRPSRR
ncbi:MAG: YggS family pyridoxal phosphate-dependent enzyme [Nostocoides sp.]